MLVKQTDINFKDYTMSRQVIDGVVANVLKLTNIENPDIIYSTNLSNSNLTQGGIGEGRKADFGVNGNQVLLEVTETRTEDNRIMRGLGMIDVELPLFVDPKYKVQMLSNCVEYNVELELTLRHRSRSAAEAWKSDKMSRIDSGLETFVTEGDFHYVIPETCFKLASDVLAAAKINDPSEDRDLAKYCEDSFTSAVTIVTDQAGKNKTAVATHRISRVEVIFEDGKVDKERDEKGEFLGGYVSRLACRFTYSRPETIMLHYPSMINCSLINQDWWYDGEIPGLSDERGTLNTPFISAGEKIIPELPYLNLPIFLQGVDYKLPKFVPLHETEVSFMTAYLDYVEDNGTATPMFNLKELGDFELMDSVKEHLEVAIGSNQYLRDSLIRVYIIINGVQVPLEDVAISPDLTVWYNGKMDILKVYQMVITIDLSLAGMSHDKFDVVRRTPAFLDDYLSDFHPQVKKHYDGHFEEDVMHAKVLDEIVEVVNLDPIINEAKNVGKRSIYMLNILNGRIVTRHT